MDGKKISFRLYRLFHTDVATQSFSQQVLGRSGFSVEMTTVHITLLPRYKEFNFKIIVTLITQIFLMYKHLLGWGRRPW